MLAPIRTKSSIWNTHASHLGHRSECLYTKTQRTKKTRFHYKLLRLKVHSRSLLPLPNKPENQDAAASDMQQTITINT